MKISTENRILNIHVKNVLYAPEIDSNLISVSKLTDQGFEVRFKKNVCKVIKENFTIEIGTNRNSVYVVNVDKEKIMLLRECISYETLHRRFGHRNMYDLNVLLNSELKNEYRVNGEEFNCGKCEICLKGKCSRLPFKPSITKSNKVLDFIHSDLPVF